MNVAAQQMFITDAWDKLKQSVSQQPAFSLETIYTLKWARYQS